MKSPDHQKKNITRYVGLETHGEKVKRVEKISQESIYDTTYNIWDVQTDKNRWWVIEPFTNLYLQSDFPSMDYAISFHVGLTTRISANQNTSASEEDVWYTPKAWRQWQQAFNTMEKAREAEDYQAVGNTCRESLLTFIKELETKRKTRLRYKIGDVKNQLDSIADYLTSGKSLKRIRTHLKNSAFDTWDIVAWLTHYQNATRDDAKYALRVTEQLMLNYTQMLIKKDKPSPERCPKCNSYQVISDFRSELINSTDNPYVDLCESCGWESKKKIK